jgi:hypothetical protein
MARLRTPTEQLRAKGAFAKDPQRSRNDPPTAGPIGSWPAHLKLNERAVWDEIVTLAPEGVLTSADRLGVEQLARMIAKARLDEEINLKQDARIGWWLARFGMTSVDRAKFSVPEAEAPEDPADKHLQ